MPDHLMSGPENAPVIEPVQELSANAPVGGPELLEMVANLQIELASLKGDVLDLKGQLSEVVTEAAELNEPEVEQSLSTPQLSIVDNGSADEADPSVGDELSVLPSEAHEDRNGSAEVPSTLEALDVEAIELEPVEREGLSEEEMDALLTATSQIGMQEPEMEVAPTQNSESTVQPSESDSAAREPAPPASPVAPVTGGTLLSEAEIMTLLAEAKGAPRVLPAEEKPVVAPSEPAAELVSADEIKAMLGIQHPEDSSEPEPLAPIVEAVEVKEEAPVDVSPEFAPSEMEAMMAESEVDLENVDASAVARVSGALAAAALALPVCVVGEVMHCLCVEPFDSDAIAQISSEVGLQVVPHAAPLEKVLAELRGRYGDQDESVARQCAPTAPPGIVSRLLAKVQRKSA